ncbi:MAG: hypothetical protein KO202_06210 [Methanobacteriaceae archaeon]|jgi:hypothetical protein|nr:hypothetical protein [Methanobacteriaceae archaeon]
MSINQIESNLEAITQTIAYLEKQEVCDENLLKELKKERDKLLKDINLI